MDYMSHGNAAGTAANSLNVYTGSIPAPSDESASKVRDQVSMTEQLLSELHEAISQLERRIEVALMPMPPTPAPTGPNVNKQVGSHLLGRVQILTEGFQSAVARIHALRQRVEL